MNFRGVSMNAAATMYEAPELAERNQHYRGRISLTRLLHPMTLILALQVGLSLTMVRANTAFTDEAEYLTGGHLEIAHWLHGARVPPDLTNTFSGSPIIYPPIGAIADSIGGLTGARLLSLGFMLAASILLYSTAKQLIGESAALYSVIIWVISAPVMRLGALATYDAMSIFMTALSAWLALRVSTGRHPISYVIASATALAVANAVAYSGISIDVIVIPFAFLTWSASFGIRRAGVLVAWFLFTIGSLFAGLLTISQSWSGIVYTIFLRGATGGVSYQRNAVGFILKNVWIYSGLCLILAGIGFMLVLLIESGAHRWLFGITAAALLVVPVAQFHDLTEISFDKHLAYGIWFGAITGGYALQRAVRSVPRMRGTTVILCGALALSVPVIDSWQVAMAKQQSWANTTSLMNAVRPIAASVTGIIYVDKAEWVARYYTPQGYDWSRWNVSGLPLSLPDVPADRQVASYAGFLKRSSYGVIVLLYTTSISALPVNVVLSPKSYIARVTFLNIVTGNSPVNSATATGEAALTIALEQDQSYRLVSVGPYNSSISAGVYGIWEKAVS